MDEAKLLEKLRLIEALYAGAATVGEKDAAGRARHRILERLEELARDDPPVEYQFSMADIWSRHVFVALLRRYGIRPYQLKQNSRTVFLLEEVSFDVELESEIFTRRWLERN
ncbi:MAG: hypothetical protein WBP17_12240 [Gemmatimonadota bacterium]